MYDLPTKNESKKRDSLTQLDSNEYSSRPNECTSTDIFDYQPPQNHKWLDDYGWL